MTYATITDQTSPNQNARPAGCAPQSITIHHWGVDGQSFDAVVRYLCRPGGASSAHYVVEAGRVACIVDPDRRAWHAGTAHGNDVSIGIECRPEASDGDYQTVAELVADLRATYGPLPLVRHSDWKPTACPGRWNLDRINQLANQEDDMPTIDEVRAVVRDEIARDRPDRRSDAYNAVWVNGLWTVPGTDRLENPGQFLSATRVAAVQAVHAAGVAVGIDPAKLDELIAALDDLPAVPAVVELDGTFTVTPKGA